MRRVGGGSLALGFTLIALGVLTVGQSALAVWFLMDQKALHEELLRDKMAVVARLLGDEYSVSLKDRDFAALNAQAEGLRGDRNLLGLRILDEGNSIIVKLSFSEDRELPDTWNPFYIPWENTLTEPIISRGRQIGKLQLDYSGEQANEVIRGLMIRPPVAQAIVFALMLLALHYFFRQKVAEPLDRLTQGVREASKGNLSLRVIAPGGGEIGTLGGEVERLTERLSGIINTQRMTIERLHESAGSVGADIKRFREGSERIKARAGDLSGAIGASGDSFGLISDLSDQLSEGFSDNVSALLEVKAMADEIVSAMENMVSATENSYATVAQMAQTSKAIAASSDEILSSVEKTSASVEEVIASVREVEKSAKKSSALAEDVREKAAKEGVNTVAEAVEGMTRITEKVEHAMQIVRQLDKRSQDIEMILSVIRDVTEKTSLLSLNAAILAEKAGVHGKGFAVVAGEMRALSGRTAQSTKDIEGIIKTIQAEIHEVVSAITRGMDMTREGSAQVYQVGVIMSEILEAAYNSALMTRTIEKATEEQVRALDHIEGAMIDISMMASSMTKATDEQLTGSAFMLERVGEVREIAETTKRGTAEQAAGTTTIFRNFELATDSLGRIGAFITSERKLRGDVSDMSLQIRDEAAGSLAKAKAAGSLLGVMESELKDIRNVLDVYRTTAKRTDAGWRPGGNA